MNVDWCVPAGSVSWIASLAIALLTGLVALFAGGMVADWCVTWYHISAFEGASGYFVVFAALLSGIGGTIVGLVVARAVAGAGGRTLTATGLSVATVCLVATGVASAARLLADVPPEIDGERLWLLVELRWTTPPVERTEARSLHPDVHGVLPGTERTGFNAFGSAWHIRLGSLSGSTLRREARGRLFTEDVRQEDNAWIVPGIVDVFTSRGNRVLGVYDGDRHVTATALPLPRSPGHECLTWSEWLPAVATGTDAGDAPVSYRYRVVPRNAPVRWQHAGPFVIETRVASLFPTDDAGGLSANSRFDVRYGDNVLPGLEDATSISMIATSPVTLLARSLSMCRLITSTDDGASATDQPRCADDGPVWRLDPTGATRVTQEHAPRGWFDRDSFTEPGLYVLGPAVLDTRSLAITANGWPVEPSHQFDLPPLGLSPDATSMVWFSPADYDHGPALATRRLDTGETTTLPIDRVRMRFRTPELDVDPTWLLHHFTWVTGDDGAQRLQVKAAFDLLPHRGALSPAADGEWQSYAVSPGGAALQAAIVDILVAQLKGQRIEDEYATTATPRLTIDGMIVYVQHIESDSSVSVNTSKSVPAVMARIASHIDDVLASGRLDAAIASDAR
ncbi:MAG: hypothetical protein IT182_01095 [Acidobacteria bacterium]|nr:hypothetical protein [Acidobacteriota bacterium]